MILHEIPSSPWSNRVFSWWAVDSETLTLARCSIRNRYRLSLGVVRPDATVPVEASFNHPPDLGDAAIGLLFGCRQRFKRLMDAPGLLGPARSDLMIPEYILFGDQGIPHSIMHTQDPVFIASYVDGRVPEPKGNLLAYRSNVGLPASGWEYWSTDAYQEFERLSLDYEEHRAPILENSL